MSAELLRRAAKTLRERAEAASPGPWIAASHTGRKDGIALVGRAEDRGTGRAIAVLAGVDVRQRHADAHYVELIHPPVALAMASWLDATAAVADANDEHDGFDLSAVDDTWLAALDVAAAVLREPWATPRNRGQR